ncbi:hypothetical protein STCU_01384 [Strigomonas culicis]|nr:hypothetical protein STCU_01384 [Strigomonas culicis]|eukprot:EPY34718.1 hypothetical protein STCU_01384 [Strigomonas culicis]
MYPQRISDSEIEFSKLLYNIKGEFDAATNRFTSPRVADRITRRSSAQLQSRALQRTLPHVGVRHLVVPEAIVVKQEEERGLLMPLYECSLRAFLHLHGQRYVNGLTDNSGMHHERRSGAFLSQPRFEPIANMEVIAAIVFQILSAIDLMNHNMPHTVNGKEVRGYNHNDIHLDNVLIMPDGHIALCDFELVSHRKSHDDGAPSLLHLTRLPPPSRQSPHGLFDSTADVWATGLVTLNLLTGVDPLFSNDSLMNDFGSGPLLMPYNSPGRASCVPVLDWQDNIQQHVRELLQAIDPSRRRQDEAAPLLQLCSRCLVNRAGAQPAAAETLLKDPLFTVFQATPEKAKHVVKEWIAKSNAASPSLHKHGKW